MTDPKDKPQNDPVPSTNWKPSPPEMDLEPIPSPDQPGESGTEDADAPPARTGMSQQTEKPAEAAGDDNPVHHTGRVPPKVTPGV
ncbi:hypothetical protein [Rhizobium mesosinicum]|uniref:Uncharacterized protein n=1 Tax=Rhizobium mesosinicum TaxID=335017 RepID=A0ABS7GY48_9HYPH|nr:hypothetical protein [Rhizobium mesosinicum]MBW9054537.1 hypothetical protein [Rhizobium mesosinicum]